MSISVQNISKSFKNVSAIQNISFEVKSGELFGLIGPDGAGKTTLFRTLTTLLIPNEGNAIVAGHDIIKNVKEIRNSVGYMPGKFSLYQDLTIAENLAFFATIFGTTIEENYDLIEDIYVQIEPFKNRRAGALSGGMKQKLALCCALIHKPEVLFLDEPTTGVDPVSRKEFWEMLKRLQQWALPKSLSEGSLVNNVFSDGLNLESLFPSEVPPYLCLSFGNKRYAPMLIQSLSMPIGGVPINKNGARMHCQVQANFVSRTAWDQLNINSTYQGGAA